MVERTLFIFGLGYSSQEVARAAIANGFRVSGTCRTQEKCDMLKEQGINGILFSEVSEKHLLDATHILSSIPPQEGAGDVAVPFIQYSNKWLGYFSTTGVYGDYEGQWVDEESAPRPNNDRLKRRLEAESQWRERGGHVFRLAGIYGPGRSAVDDVLAGKARRIDKPGQVFSRIHVYDIAQIVLASINRPNPKAIYNACDNEPAAAHEVVQFACKLLDREAPPLIPYEQAELTPMGKEFYSANRRVKNERIKQELGVKLQYPTYRDGLKAIALNSLK